MEQTPLIAQIPNFGPDAKDAQIRVAICVPSGDRVHMRFTLSLCSILLSSAHITYYDKPIAGRLLNHQCSILCLSRERLVQAALKDGATHVLFLDSDMEFPPDTLHRLLSHEKDVVGAVYSKRTAQEMVVPYKGMPFEGLQEVNQLATGCLLVKTDVFRKMPTPWFEFLMYQHGEDAEPRCIGEDISFSRKCKDADYKLYCDFDLSQELTHLGEVGFVLQFTRPDHEQEVRQVL